MQSSKVVLLTSLVFIFFGCAMLIAGGVVCRRTQGFLDRATYAQGNVIAHEYHPPEKRQRKVLVSQGVGFGARRPPAADSASGTWGVVVQFEPTPGRQVVYRPSYHSNPPSHSVGADVEVAFDPDRPEAARLVGFDDLWLTPTILGGMGAVFLIVGTALYRNRGGTWQWHARRV